VSRTNLDLIIVLSHELGVALEMTYDAVELRELWPDALEGLKEARDLIKAENMPVPAVITNVLRLYESV
jgi:hypothetical protein